MNFREDINGYIFCDSMVFVIIRAVTPSIRGELGITPVNNTYLSLGELTYDIIEGGWIDAGTPEAYNKANTLLSAIDNQIIQDK